MDSNPLVSVIIPCYNAAATLARAIDSARRQTYRPIEIIAIDDASTDDTLAMLEAEAARGDVKVVALARNMHCGGARNAGVAQSHGTFLAFLDADDEWLPEKLSRQMAIIGTDPNMAFIACDITNIGIDGTVRRNVFAALRPGTGKEAWRTLLAYSFSCPSTVVVRRSAFEAVGGYRLDTVTVEDQDFAIRVALIGELGYVKESLAIAHTQATSVSYGSARREIKLAWPVIRAHIEAQQHRLSRKELRYIYGSRYARLGRNVYPVAPFLGAAYILRGMLNGHEPIRHALFLLTASPWSRWLKARLGHRAGADTLART